MDEIYYGPSKDINDQLDWLLQKQQEWALEMDEELRQMEIEEGLRDPDD
jgi:hypothetical protein